MKCVLCNRRKGKRHCPAKSSFICAQCCGEKRVVEVDCPRDCTFLESGQDYQTQKKYLHQLRGDNPVRAQRHLETLGRFGHVLFGLEVTVLEFSRGLNSLRDKVVLEAARLLLRTYRTESRGIIFEHTHTDPLVESLARDLKSFLEEARQGSDKFERLTVSAIVDTLEALELDVEFHLQSRAYGSYLEFIARGHPESSQGSEIQPLIQP